MPLYDYNCRECGDTERYISLQDVDKRIRCKCGKKMTRLVSTASRPVILGYWSDNLQHMITGPKQKQEVMKKRHVLEKC